MADANTIELATQEMQAVLNYLDNAHITSGYTSILYRTPDEDVQFWYQNMKSSLDELRKVDDKTTQLERINVLMKLRETILDQGDKGTSVTQPAGISKSPSNGAYAVIGIVTLVLCVVGIIMIMSWGNDHY